MKVMRLPVPKAFSPMEAAAIRETFLRAARGWRNPAHAWRVIRDLWRRFCAAAGMEGLTDDPQAIKSAIHLSETALDSCSAPPKLGEHTHEVLTRLLGLYQRRLLTLGRQGVIWPDDADH